MLRPVAIALLAVLAPSACSKLSDVGQPPQFSPTVGTDPYYAMMNQPMPASTRAGSPFDDSSLWNADRRSLLGDRRAATRGDILTVVIEIDERAEMSNTSQRSRTGSERMGIPSLLGIPQRANEILPDGATLADAVDFNSQGRYTGTGSVRRSEKLTLKVAATVVEVLPNGILRIEGTQEVRVNNELRDLIVTGYVRPEDVSRQNAITYDKIAAARISYGGRGLVSTVQQPRYGQEAADRLLPF